MAEEETSEEQQLYDHAIKKGCTPEKALAVINAHPELFCFPVEYACMIIDEILD